MEELTKEQFEIEYATKSNLTLEQVYSLGLRGVRCDCDYENCRGWKMESNININELTKKITQILDQFAKEEYGNRLSQFAILSLKSMILSEIKKLEKPEGE